MGLPSCTALLHLFVLHAASSLAKSVNLLEAKDVVVEDSNASTVLFQPSDYLSHLYPSYPTAFTTTQSLLTSIVDDPIYAINTIYEIFDMDMTTVESWTAAPTSFPYEHVVTYVTTTTHTYWATPESDGKTTVETLTQSTLATYHLSPPQPSVQYLPPYTEAGIMPCDGDCQPDGYVGDATCEMEGLQTGCFRQCDYREGLFWCRKFDVQDWETRMDGSNVMGQACWGGNQTIQLLQQCLVGDIPVGCINCSWGLDPSWRPVLGEFNT